MFTLQLAPRRAYACARARACVNVHGYPDGAISSRVGCGLLVSQVLSCSSDADANRISIKPLDTNDLKRRESKIDQDAATLQTYYSAVENEVNKQRSQYNAQVECLEKWLQEARDTPLYEPQARNAPCENPDKKSQAQVLKEAKPANPSFDSVCESVWKDTGNFVTETQPNYVRRLRQRSLLQVPGTAPLLGDTTTVKGL